MPTTVSKRPSPLLAVFALAALLMAIASPASAADCPTAVSVNPNPVWLDGPITVSGTGWAVGTSIFINLDGKQLGSTTTNSSGAFSLSSTVPIKAALGSVKLFVQDGPANCEVLQKQQVLASEPTPTTTTTTTTTTAPSTTTTTLPPTTSTTAPSTTTTPPTTVTPTSSIAATTAPSPTSIAATPEPQLQTSSSTEAADSTSSGFPILTGLLAALAGAALVGGGIVFERSRRSDQ